MHRSVLLLQANRKLAFISLLGGEDLALFEVAHISWLHAPNGTNKHRGCIWEQLHADAMESPWAFMKITGQHTAVGAWENKAHEKWQTISQCLWHAASFQCPCSSHKRVSGWQRKWDMQHIITGYDTWGDFVLWTPMSCAILSILKYGKVHCSNKLWSFQRACWFYFFVPLQRGNCQSAWGILHPVNFIGHVEEEHVSLLNKILT